jgi:CheY-like chemotaxis protein
MESADRVGMIHQHYMDIINSIPDPVYWIDMDCNLAGCNHSFISLMDLKHQSDLNGSPYALMKNHAQWPDERIDAFKLDDMCVIFSGVAVHNVEEKKVIDAKKNTIYFKSTRALMYDEEKHVIGLIVVLSDITELKLLQENKKNKLLSDIPSNKKAFENNRLLKVLLIEDNIIAQNVECALLTALNCQVDVADTGDKALQLFNPGKYDLVLMDIGLGDTSGYIVAKQLRNKEKDTQYHVPIIALTGYEADVVKYDCEQYFMEGAITKPLTSEQAEQLIKHYVYHMDVEVHGLKSI